MENTEEVDKLKARLKARFSETDLDEHVHELKAGEAAAINNYGIDAQIAYIVEAAGVDWAAGLLDEET